jgi:hypothetical protein
VTNLHHNSHGEILLENIEHNSFRRMLGLGSVPQTFIKCPIINLRLEIPAPMDPMTQCLNDGCDVSESENGMKDHMGLCFWAEIECPCPGCYTRMRRHQMKRHLEENVREHMDKAVFVVKWQAYEMKKMSMRYETLINRYNDLLEKFNGKVFTQNESNEIVVFNEPVMHVHKECHEYDLWLDSIPCNIFEDISGGASMPSSVDIAMTRTLVTGRDH